MKFVTNSLIISLFWMPIASSHYFWAEELEEDNVIEVVFSEQAGVPDPVLSHLADRVTEMTIITGNDDAMSIPLENKGDHLIGRVDVDESSSPYLAVGFLDYGPFREMTPPPDLQYTFAVQVSEEESDWTVFFEQLSSSSSLSHFTIVMKSCGPPYTFAVIAGDEKIQKVDVCLFEKGGLKLGCTSGKPDDDTNLVMIDDDEAIITTAAGNTLYALANATIGEPDSRTIMFASTSVTFEGPCTE